jgi:lysophospholipase L1-like esterase
VYLAGDSTVTNYTLTTPKDESDKEWAGWGMMLAESFNTKVSVVNKAVGGMTARHFIQAGNLDAILALLKSGDYFLFQFGTNDSNTTASYTINGVSYPYFASTTDFKTYLQTYIDGAKTKGAIPVLVTPPPRNSAYCGGGRSMAGYADAMVELGAAQKVAVINLSIKTHSYLSAICPAPASAAAETFFKVYLKSGTLTIDGTHFQEHGARTMAGFVAAGTKEVGLGLAAYLL